MDAELSLTWCKRESCYLLTVYFQVIVQNYNSVLTLAHLYQLSDAILVHENDTVHRICSRLLNIKHISFSDINRVIAHQLGSILQPALTADSHGAYSRNPLGEKGQTLLTPAVVDRSLHTHGGLECHGNFLSCCFSRWNLCTAYIFNDIKRQEFGAQV